MIRLVSCVNFISVCNITPKPTTPVVDFFFFDAHAYSKISLFISVYQNGVKNINIHSK